MIRLLTRVCEVANRTLSRPCILFSLLFASCLALQAARQSHTRHHQRQMCRAYRHRIARAEGAYWQVHHQFITGEETALVFLVQTGALDDVPLCPQGGDYRVIDEGDGSVTVHCSLAAHDLEDDGTQGLRRIPDPLTDIAQ